VTRLLTVADVCDVLRCSRTYVYSLMQRGDLRVLKLGRLTRIPVDAVEEFIAQKVHDSTYDVCESWSNGGARETRRG